MDNAEAVARLHTYLDIFSVQCYGYIFQFSVTYL